MYKKLLDLLNKIIKDEKLLDKIVKTETFDELYDIIINIQSDLNISKKELRDFVEKYSKELNDEQLSEIAGGVKDLEGKIIPSVMASMLSLLTMAQTGASAVGNETTSSPSVSAVMSKKETKEKGFIAKNIGKLTAGAGLLAAFGVCLVKSNQISEYEKELRKKTKEELMEMLPVVWGEFFVAWGVAAAATRNAGAASDAAKVARDAACDAACDAAGYAAYYAAWLAPWHTGNAALGASVAAMNDAWDAVRAADGLPPYLKEAALNAHQDATVAVFHAHQDATVAAWDGPQGAAYRLVQNNDRQYFVNLLKVLREQIDKLNAIAFEN